ncbi:hypothetical protein ACPCSD_14720 [Streptomyces griseoincarnatus]
MTDQKAPEGPQERPEGGSATPHPPEGGNGAQTDADGVQRHERHVHVTIRHRDAYTANRQALSLVDWIRAEFPELEATTDAHEWPAHNAGPTVAECAEADRRWWNGEKAGER